MSGQPYQNDKVDQQGNTREEGGQESSRPPAMKARVAAREQIPLPPAIVGRMNANRVGRRVEKRCLVSDGIGESRFEA